MIGTRLSAPGFGSEASLPGIPRTPPYTPSRTKRAIERSRSPASSNAGSVHPAETTSPDKKAALRTEQDGIRIQELVEGDAGYHTDLDVVYPQHESSDDNDDNDDSDDDSDSSSASDTEAAHITRSLSQLQCEDAEQKEFENRRARMRFHKRTDSRVYKRSHSQSITNETGTIDHESKDDHDLESSKRRLRRRVRGPQHQPSAFNAQAGSSSDPGVAVSSTDSESDTVLRASIEFEIMDLDADT